MTRNQALVPQILIQYGNRTWQNILAVLAGVTLISLLAQLSIPLPFTPVPITGQTFGVVLTALLWGQKRAVSTVVSYMLLGGLGLPVFAMGKSGFLIGPTTGYLLGMLAASFVVGRLADLGWTRSFYKTWLAAFLGSVSVFSFGLYGLSFFVPQTQLLNLGLLPFLPGDFIKTILASTMAWQSHRLLNNKK